MFDLIQAVLSGAAFDRVFSFFRRVAARLAGRLRKAGIRAAQTILDAAREALLWLRRIGGILGRNLSRFFTPVRTLFRALIDRSEARLARAR